MIIQFLDTFAKLRKATVTFVMSVCPHGTTRLPLAYFREILYSDTSANEDNLFENHIC